MALPLCGSLGAWIDVRISKERGEGGDVVLRPTEAVQRQVCASNEVYILMGTVVRMLACGAMWETCGCEALGGKGMLMRVQ